MFLTKNLMQPPHAYAKKNKIKTHARARLYTRKPPPTHKQTKPNNQRNTHKHTRKHKGAQQHAQTHEHTQARQHVHNARTYKRKN